MHAVWDNFVTQVSGINVEAGNTLAEQISIETEKDKIRKQIADLERKARRETQSKKKFEMFQRIKEYQRRLEEMK
jgi:regulator of replication initiation timing